MGRLRRDFSIGCLWVSIAVWVRTEMIVLRRATNERIVSLKVSGRYFMLFVGGEQVKTCGVYPVNYSAGF